MPATTYREKLSTLITLPDISDVSVPGVLGPPPGRPKPKKKPKKKTRAVQYHGVRLARPPLKFEAQILNLTGIPPRLDAAWLALHEQQVSLADTVAAIAQFGARQVLEELRRQGAPQAVLMCRVPLDIRAVLQAVAGDRHQDVMQLHAYYRNMIGQRRLPASRRHTILTELVDRRLPALDRRYAKRAVNEAFAFGRWSAIQCFSRVPAPFDLAKSTSDKLIDGNITVDAVVQTAILDLSTCEECEDVDGEVMDLGSDRQAELHPPYVKCFGGLSCRCVQIGLLSDGSEIDVDEIPEEVLAEAEDDWAEDQE